MSGAHDWGSAKQSARGENVPISVHCGTPNILHQSVASSLTVFFSHKDSQPFPAQTHYLDWLEYRSLGGLSRK